MNQVYEKNNQPDDTKIRLVLYGLRSAGYNPFDNITVKEVAKDLKLGENKANEVFRRKDFPSVNIGKTKTISVLAYFLWKLDRHEEEKNG